MPSKHVVIYVKDFYKPFFDKIKTFQDVDTKLAPLVCRAVKAYVENPDLPRLRHYLKEHPEEIKRWKNMIEELELDKVSVY